MSLRSVSIPIQVIGYWISPLGCIKQYLTIQDGYQVGCFMLILSFNGYLYIVHQEYLLYLTNITVDERVAC